jgi:CheY-like chemotaxis protein
MIEPFEERDRRGFPRTAMSVLIQVQVVPNAAPLDEDLSQAISGLSTDVSRGGMGAWVGHEIPDRTDCIVRFFNSRGRLKPELAWGVIRRLDRRQDGFVVGVEFDTPLEFLRLAEGGKPLGEGGTVRALVVDDEASIRNLLARFLSRRGFDVETAANGEEALEMINVAPPDILVMDLYMPKVNGHEVLKQIKENDLGVGIICTISGYASDDDASECLRLGAADHLAKPLDLKQLDWSIRLRLESKEG